MKSKTLQLLLLTLSVASAQTFQQETATIPVSQNGRQLQIPWNGGFNSLSIAMPDIDGDGDPDVILTGRDDGSLQLYQNNGDGPQGKFDFVSASVSNLEFGPNDNRITFDDIDFDGDFDLFVGANDGRIKFYENTGNATIPDYQLITDFFDSIDVGGVSAPRFTDLNGDGLNDLLIGSYNEGIFYFTRDDSNTTQFIFSNILYDTTGQLIKPGFLFATPVFADLDNDVW